MTYLVLNVGISSRLSNMHTKQDILKAILFIFQTLFSYHDTWYEVH